MVWVNVACSNAVPQSVVITFIPIVRRGRYGQVSLSLEVDFSSSLVINEDDFCELKKWSEKWNMKSLFLQKPKLNTFLILQVCS